MLHNAVIFLSGLHQFAPFIYIVGNGFFNVGILAGLTGPDPDQGMPVVAGGYGYRIQILVLQGLANILNTLGTFTLFAFNGAGPTFKESAVRIDEIGNLHIFHA